MAQGNFTENFRLDAIKQITARGHSVPDVSKRLGVSAHLLYSWKKRYAASPTAVVQDDLSAEIRRLKQELARVTEERDVLKRGEPLRTRISPRIQNEIRIYKRASPAIYCASHVQHAHRSSQRLLYVVQATVQQTGCGGSDLSHSHSRLSPL